MYVARTRITSRIYYNMKPNGILRRDTNIHKTILLKLKTFQETILKEIN